VVVIEARSDGRARAVESVPVTFAGADQVISFNPQYLLDGLAAAALTGQVRAPASGDAEPPTATGRIRLEFTSPAKPALISWADGDARPGADETATGSGSDGGNGAAHHAAAGAVADGPERAQSQPAEAAPFRYLVVPVRTPAPG
jgi:DNA polymerase III sliding clamp (beta) subunit (PCNA family)